MAQVSMDADAARPHREPAPSTQDVRMNGLITILYDWPRVVAGSLGWAAPLAANAPTAMAAAPRIQPLVFMGAD